MSGRGEVKRVSKARFAQGDAGRELAVSATLAVFGMLPIGFVSTMMLLQIFGVWTP